MSRDTVNNSQARIQRGGNRGSGTTPPPLRFVRGGLLCRGLLGRRGGPTVVFILLLSIFFRSPVFYKHITGIHTSKFNVHYETVIFVLDFPCLIMKRIQLPNPCFITLKGIFCLELHDLKPFKPKIFWGRTPLPVTSTISKLPRHPCVCVERLAIVQKTISYKQLTFATF